MTLSNTGSLTFTNDEPDDVCAARLFLTILVSTVAFEGAVIFYAL